LRLYEIAYSTEEKPPKNLKMDHAYGSFWGTNGGWKKSAGQILEIVHVGFKF
jgi:hypothetical protein